MSATRRAAHRGPLRGALLLATLVLAAACGTTPRQGADAGKAIADPVKFLQSRERFELAGRVAGAVNGEGFNAQLELQQRGQASEVVLRSALGFGSATVRTDGERLEFRSSRGEKLDGEAGINALTQRLGFEPPVRSLRFWLLGVPDPALPLSADPALPAGSAFEQLGWRVTITEAKPTFVDAGVVSLPRRVTLERTPVRLRIVVDKWHLGR